MFIVIAFGLHGKHNFKGVNVDVIYVDIRFAPCVGWVVNHNILLRPRFFKERVDTVKYRYDGINFMNEEQRKDVILFVYLAKLVKKAFEYSKARTSKRALEILVKVFVRSWKPRD